MCECKGIKIKIESELLLHQEVVDANNESASKNIEQASKLAKLKDKGRIILSKSENCNKRKKQKKN